MLKSTELKGLCRHTTWVMGHGWINLLPLYFKACVGGVRERESKVGKKGKAELKLGFDKKGGGARPRDEPGSHVFRIFLNN